MEIYEYPVNKFVGGFIGSPGMNFLPARIVAENSKTYVETKSFRLLIPENKVSYIQSHGNAEVILGIRPEHIQDSAFADASSITDTFKALVEVVETLGAEVQLDVTVGGHAMIARVDARSRAQRHADIELAVNMDKIHFFEKDPPHMRIPTEMR